MPLYQGGCLAAANVCLPDSYHSSAPFPGNVSDTPLMVKVCPLSVSPSPRHISRNRGARRHHVPGHTRENTRTRDRRLLDSIQLSSACCTMPLVSISSDPGPAPETRRRETRMWHVTIHVVVRWDHSCVLRCAPCDLTVKRWQSGSTIFVTCISPVEGWCGPSYHSMGDVPLYPGRRDSVTWCQYKKLPRWRSRSRQVQAGPGCRSREGTRGQTTWRQ